MRPALVPVLLAVAVCLPSCKRSSSTLPGGSASIRIGDNGWGMCHGWKGNEILYVLFLREAEATPSGLEWKAGTSNISEVHIVHRDVVLDGKDFTVDFTSATPNAINIAGNEYTLSKGRIFLCSVENGALLVQQVDLPIQRNSDYPQEMKRLAAELPVQGFLSAAANKPAGRNK